MLSQNKGLPEKAADVLLQVKEYANRTQTKYIQLDF